MSLPLDVVYDVLDVFAVSANDEDHSCNAAALRNCALVCRSWCFPAQQRLFQHVSFTTAPLGSYSPRKPILNRVRLLRNILSGEGDTTTFRANQLARAIHSLTLLENSTHQDPSLYPQLRVSASQFSELLSLLPNLRSLHIKSGLLHPEMPSVPHMYGDAGRAAAAGEKQAIRALANVTALSIVQERASHHNRVLDFISGNHLPMPMLSVLSWKCFEGVAAEAHADILFASPLASSSSSPASYASLIDRPLTSLTLDFPASGPSLALLYGLVRTSIQHQSLRSLHLPHLPPSLPPHLARQARTVTRSESSVDAQKDSITDPVSSLSDIIRLLQPSLRILTLGSPPTTSSASPPGSPALANRSRAFLERFGAGMSTDPIDLSEVAPQLETLICTSYPLDPLLLGPGGSAALTARASSSRRSGPSHPRATVGPSTSAPASEDANSNPDPASISPSSNSTPSTRLPPSLQRLEVRLSNPTLRSSPAVWASVLDSVLATLVLAVEESRQGFWCGSGGGRPPGSCAGLGSACSAAGGREVRMGRQRGAENPMMAMMKPPVQRVVLELPDKLISAMKDRPSPSPSDRDSQTATGAGSADESHSNPSPSILPGEYAHALRLISVASSPSSPSSVSKRGVSPNAQKSTAKGDLSAMYAVFRLRAIALEEFCVSSGIGCEWVAVATS